VPHEADQEKNQEEKEQEFCDSSSGKRDGAETQQAGDDGDNQKY
jgi:hypothetical protein